MPSVDPNTLNATLSAARQHLLAAIGPKGHWQGELSSSALSTATAVCALAITGSTSHASLVFGGLNWLAAHANADGGWGDTVCSRSNLSTTVLAWSAFAFGENVGRAYLHAERVEKQNCACNAPCGLSSTPYNVLPAAQYAAAIRAAEEWIVRAAGSLEPAQLAEAIASRYGKDRTFSAPILTLCALAGRLGPTQTAWPLVPALPFELAALPHWVWKSIRMPVVSYALPALIAIGLVRFRHAPPKCPVTKLLRRRAERHVLKVLESIQPASGGFLEAAPLTSFVAMSLAGAGLADHPVVARSMDFLASTVRSDGSWPIDTNLDTWVTSLSLNALAAGGDLKQQLSPAQQGAALSWLLAQQTKAEHPYTHAAPGGWAWTNLSGGVTDADDTPGALRVLNHLQTVLPGSAGAGVAQAAQAGVRWLLGLQNSDGGIPTFCRGWGTLPFDRSSPDLTAHAILAWSAWQNELPAKLQSQTAAAIRRAVAYLAKTQRPDGAWVPLWFGNEHAANEENPVYGASRVVLGLLGISQRSPELEQTIGRGAAYLQAAQNSDGGWGGEKAAPSSIEETSLAVDALAKYLLGRESCEVHAAVMSGTAWLVQHTHGGQEFPPSPIGLYFARLWYFEKLYPLIFAVSALGRVSRLSLAATSATIE